MRKSNSKSHSVVLYLPSEFAMVVTAMAFLLVLEALIG